MSVFHFYACVVNTVPHLPTIRTREPSEKRKDQSLFCTGKKEFDVLGSTIPVGNFAPSTPFKLSCRWSFETHTFPAKDLVVGAMGAIATGSLIQMLDRPLSLLVVVTKRMGAVKGVGAESIF